MVNDADRSGASLATINEPLSEIGKHLLENLTVIDKEEEPEIRSTASKIQNLVFGEEDSVFKTAISEMQKLQKDKESSALLEQRCRESKKLYSIIASLNPDQISANRAYIQLLAKKTTTTANKRDKPKDQAILLKNPKDSSEAFSKSISKAQSNFSKRSNNTKQEERKKEDSLLLLAEYYQTSDISLPMETLHSIQVESKDKFNKLLNVGEADNFFPDKVSTTKHIVKNNTHQVPVATPLAPPLQSDSQYLLENLNDQHDILLEKESEVIKTDKQEEHKIKGTLEQKNVTMEVVNIEPGKSKLSIQRIPGIAVPPKPKAIFENQKFVSIVKKDDTESNVSDIQLPDVSICKMPSTSIDKPPSVAVEKSSQTFNELPKIPHPSSQLFANELYTKNTIKECVEEEVNKILAERTKFGPKATKKEVPTETVKCNKLSEERIQELVESILYETIIEKLNDLASSSEHSHHPSTFEDESTNHTTTLEEDSVETPKPTPPNTPPVPDVVEDDTASSVLLITTPAPSQSEPIISPIRLPKPVAMKSDAETQVSIHSENITDIETPPMTESQSIKENISTKSHIISSENINLKEKSLSKSDKTNTVLSMSETYEHSTDMDKTLLSISLDDEDFPFEPQPPLILNKAQAHDHPKQSYSSVLGSDASYNGWRTILNDGSLSEGEVRPAMQKKCFTKQKLHLQDTELGEIVRVNHSRIPNRTLQKQTENDESSTGASEGEISAHQKGKTNRHVKHSEKITHTVPKRVIVKSTSSDLSY